MPIKRNTHDTDSDDVFDEVEKSKQKMIDFFYFLFKQNSIDRNNPKRWSQQRSLKRISTNERSSSKHNLTNQSIRKPSESTIIDNQLEQISTNLPFE